MFIGVDLGGTNIRAGVIRDGHILARTRLPTPSRSGSSAVITAMIEAVHSVLHLSGISDDAVRGVGVGVPGPANSQTGVAFELPNVVGWSDVHLAQILAEHLHFATFIANDANLAALAEHRYGAGKGAHDMIYLTVSTGIGAGIIMNDMLLEGIDGTAGEVGHMYIDMNPYGPRDAVGHIGCLEAFASGTAIALSARNLLGQNRGQGILATHRKLTGSDSWDDISAYTVTQAAFHGDSDAQSLLYHAAVALGYGCANLVHCFNPEKIVIGGGVAQAGDFLFEPIRHVVQHLTFSRPGSRVQIVPASLGDDGGLLGAAALVESRRPLLVGEEA